MASHHYTAKAAHLAVMSELAWLGYNVAMPEIDIGDDIFAVNDASGNMWRIQVKYSATKSQKKTVSGMFGCRKSQLEAPGTPELYYVFVFRVASKWRFAVISRASLLTHHQTNGFGSAFFNKSAKADFINFRLTFNPQSNLLTYGAGKNRKDVSSLLEKWTEIPKN
jgi:hypothetical protein